LFGHDKMREYAADLTIDVVEGMGKFPTVAKGYWTRGITDNILEKQKAIEKFDFRINFHKLS